MGDDADGADGGVHATVVVVDSNAHETPFAERLEQAGLAVERRPLKTGDVLVSGRGRHFIIERKAVNDFVGNHTVGVAHNGVNRWSAERSRLAGEAAASPSVTSLVLLHGIRPALDSQRHGFGRGMSGVDFYSSLMYTQLNFGVGVVHVPDETHAADWLVLLVRNLEGGKLDEGVAEIDKNAAPPDLSRKRARDSTPRELITGMLGALPGVSSKKAAAVVAVYSTLSELGAADPKALAAVVCGGGRKLGPALAARVKSLW